MIIANSVVIFVQCNFIFTARIPTESRVGRYRDVVGYVDVENLLKRVVISDDALNKLSRVSFARIVE
jgi:hypothetical protein